MNDAFGKVVAILLCAYLMFIAPVSYMIKETENTTQTYILNEITVFVEEVKNTGILDKERYNILCEKIYALSSYGSRYEIDMIHSKHGYDEDGKEIIFDIDNYYKNDILKILSISDCYYMKEADYFKMTVYKGGIPICFYGGGIKNEAY